jgi:hypothetical protein
MRRTKFQNPSKGYHWCDRCDESSDSAVCPICQKPARWVADTPLRATCAVPVETAPVACSGKIPPAEWFRRMRQQINNLNTP